MTSDWSLEQELKRAVSDHFPPGSVLRIQTEATSDSRGEDAIDVMIVFKDGAERSMTGKSAIGANSAIHSVLSGRGDDRIPIVHFATEEELSVPDEAEPLPQ